ncbi:MAG TPA: transferrin receptor-like dimerization domain-containing protein [Rhizomicrobium sp.]|jgi:N-acetylated-alpha-linked acidic dipeptidase
MSRFVLLAGVCLLAFGLTAVSPPDQKGGQPDQAALEKSFDVSLHPNEIRDWMKLMSAEPNNVGTDHDKANAEWELAQFKKFGWDAHIEEFQVLYPTPISETVELTGPKPYKVMLDEPPIPGDSSATAKNKGLPAYLAYQGDGDVTAPMVYVNYGMPDDYKALQRLGVSVKGKIVIARYGAGWRGLKPKLAYEHGAVGCLIYSDPADDGYSVESTYPDGPARPPHGFQRGSVVDMTLFAGDPLTPGVGATKDAKRLTRETSPVILKIPALPISYADAQVLLQAMGGQPVPGGWRGTLPITYRVGPSTATLHLAVKSDWGMKTIYDVIAVMKGSEFPDQWVVRGNHHDGWVFGANDPLSGQVALLAEAQAMGNLAKTGWRPKRTIVYASWDGEEPGLLGSTEWAETHAAELKQKAIFYLNSDSNERGFLSAGGNHDLERLVNAAAADVPDPETQVSVGQRLRAHIRVEALSPSSHDPATVARIKGDAKIVADPKKDIPLAPLGSGSDYSAFLEHLGVPSVDLGFGEEGSSGGVYHSRYDTFEHYDRFGDPGFAYEVALAKLVGRIVLRTADSDLPMQQAGDFADTITTYVNEVKKLADDKREAQTIQAKLLADKVFALSADPTKSSGVPDALLAVPKFDFAPLDKATANLQKAASAYDAAFAKNAAALSPERRAKLMAVMQTIDQTLAPDIGLPERPWFKNLIYAPGRMTGYGAKTLPGVREAIEDQRWADATRYIGLTAGVLDAYSARLNQAVAVLNGK